MLIEMSTRNYPIKSEIIISTNMLWCSIMLEWIQETNSYHKFSLLDYSSFYKIL